MAFLIKGFGGKQDDKAAAISAYDFPRKTAAPRKSVVQVRFPGKGMLQLQETLVLIEKHYTDEYERCGYFAAITKNALILSKQKIKGHFFAYFTSRKGHFLLSGVLLHVIINSSMKKR